MANLEQLLASVPDAKVRASLEREIAALKTKTKFGLVFERHLPETTLVGSIPIKLGDQVRLRSEADSRESSKVVALNTKTATVVDSHGHETKVKLDQLMVVKGFGEPIYPALTPLGSIQRSDERPYHAAINGENFHALQALLYLYERKVDCIYIDPPYNSGAADWKYNNRYVDANDQWRHSKWLSMMEKRLRLAKRLLKRDGVLIVTIDENESAHLGVLLEEIFPEYQRYQITIVINPKGVHKANFARVEEYALFCVPQGDLISGEAVELRDLEKSDNGANGSGDNGAASVTDDWEWHLVRRRGSESRRKDRPSMFYPIYIDEEARQVVRVGSSIPLEDDPDFSFVDGLRPVWPIDAKGEHRRWQLGAETMQAELDAGNLALGQYNKKRDSWTINIRRRKKTTKKLKSVWWEKRHDAGTHGTNVVDALLGSAGKFPFPKSIYAVRDCLAAVCQDRPDALILDFFAGSATTLHATCLLNSEDGGRRRCIVVTNDEVDQKTTRRLHKQGIYPGDSEFAKHGIFTAAARPRIEAALSGKQPDGTLLPEDKKYLNGRLFRDGFDENVEFFRIDYLDPDEIELGRAFDAIHPALWLRAGARGKRPAKIDAGKGFFIAEGCGYAVLLNEDMFRDFEQAVEQRDDIRHVFLVTDSEEAFAEMREALGRRHGRDISMLYRDYLRNFRINTRQNVR